MDLRHDRRIVMTLDAGGTNFVFSAVRGGNEIAGPVTLPSNAHDLEQCLQTITEGFKRIEKQCPHSPSAISFAFPGPCDYPNGIIGDLGNLPCFRGGVALGPMLNNQFGLPVFINNDGDLFAFGEAIAGFLPHINQLLEKNGSPKRYHNLLGLTIGTGFGAGIVSKGELFVGDNSAAAEIWVMRHKVRRGTFAEEGVSIRAVQRSYADASETRPYDALTPKEIYDIACGKKSGDPKAAVRAFLDLGEVAGDAIANASILIDGLVVIGGGLTGAQELFLPRIVQEMNSSFLSDGGDSVARMESKAFNLENPDELSGFLKGDVRRITVPGTGTKVPYDPGKRIGVGVSRLGTSKAVSIGACAFALNELDK